jgi:hypothetical protein
VRFPAVPRACTWSRRVETHYLAGPMLLESVMICIEMSAIYITDRYR